MSFIQDLDRQTERAVDKINANLRAIRAASEARRGFKSVSMTKLRKFTSGMKKRREGGF